MPIVSILNTKGGVGKTTISVNLTRYFTKELGLKTLLVDSDAQGSAFNWHEKSNGDLVDLVGLDRPTLDKDVIKFKNVYDWIFIDGSPQVSKMAISAINCSDIVLVPVQPSPYDIWASEDVITFIKDKIRLKVPLKPFLLISRAILNTNLDKNVETELEKYELPIMRSKTSQRVIYAETAAIGSTVVDQQCKAFYEIQDISKELLSIHLNTWHSTYKGDENGFDKIAISEA